MNPKGKPGAFGSSSAFGMDLLNDDDKKRRIYNC